MICLLRARQSIKFSLLIYRHLVSVSQFKFSTFFSSVLLLFCCVSFQVFYFSPLDLITRCFDTVGTRVAVAQQLYKRQGRPPWQPNVVKIRKKEEEEISKERKNLSRFSFRFFQSQSTWPLKENLTGPFIIFSLLFFLFFSRAFLSLPFVCAVVFLLFFFFSFRLDHPKRSST